MITLFWFKYQSCLYSQKNVDKTIVDKLFIVQLEDSKNLLNFSDTQSEKFITGK